MQVLESTYRELREQIAQMPVIDTHEHTKSERFRREGRQRPIELRVKVPREQPEPEPPQD